MALLLGRRVAQAKLVSSVARRSVSSFFTSNNNNHLCSSPCPSSSFSSKCAHCSCGHSFATWSCGELQRSLTTPSVGRRWFSSNDLDDDDNGFTWDPIIPDMTVDKGALSTDAAAGSNEDASGADGSIGGDGNSSADGTGTKAIKKRQRPDGSVGFKGGRKRASAYVTLKPTLPGTRHPNSNYFTVNGKPLADYFEPISARRAAAAPVILTSTFDDFEVRAQVRGGGIRGQADAVRQALAHGIRYFKPEYGSLLRHAGFITRDRRVIEEKKAGRLKARKKKKKPYR